MNSKGSARTSKKEALKIIDRFLHEYSIKEICEETGRSDENVRAYIAYYEYLNSGRTNRSCISISKDGADAICEKYGFEKDYSVLVGRTPKQAEQKPEEKLQEQLMITEPNEKPVTVGGFTGEGKYVLHYLAQAKVALTDLIKEQDRTNELLTELIGLLK